MIWAIIIVALIAISLESISGKIVFSFAVIAIGLLLLSWITGIEVLITIAKLCAVIIVVTIVITTVIAIIRKE